MKPSFVEANTIQRIGEQVRRLEKMPRDTEQPIPRRGVRRRGGAAAAATAAVRVGVVNSGTAAAWNDGGNGCTEGDISIYPYFALSDLGVFSEDSDYSVDDMVHLTASAHDESTNYSEGDLVVQNGTVYAADEVLVVGTFNPSNWRELDGEGVYRCTSNVTGPKAFSTSDWDEVLGDQFLQRNADTVDLKHCSTIGPSRGALVKWLGTKVVYLECDPGAGWS